jgi:hypothetical protein
VSIAPSGRGRSLDERPESSAICCEARGIDELANPGAKPVCAIWRMLQCSMNTQASRLHLEDVLGNLWDARRREDLGRLALVVHCDLRRWARAAKQELLAKHAQDLVLTCPLATREEFIQRVDQLIEMAESVHAKRGHPPDRGPGVEPPSDPPPPASTAVT